MASQTGLMMTLLKSAVDRALGDEEQFIAQLEALLRWYRAEPRRKGELKEHVLSVLFKGGGQHSR